MLSKLEKSVVTVPFAFVYLLVCCIDLCVLLDFLCALLQFCLRCVTLQPEMGEMSSLLSQKPSNCKMKHCSVS